MIDLLDSALFGINDDAQKLDDNIKMLKNAYADGITSLVLAPPCTLHRRGDTERFLNNRNKEQEKFKQLNLTEVPSIIYGAKVLMDHDLSLHRHIEKLCIDNGKFLLIELPNFARISDFDEWIYNLNMKGIIPIIAHVEKYPLWKNLIEGLSSVKVCYQINASTLKNFFRRNIIKKLISARKKFFIASGSRDLSLRTFSLQTTLQIARKHFPKYFSSFFLTDFNFYI